MQITFVLSFFRTVNTLTHSYDTSAVQPQLLFAKNKQKSGCLFQKSKLFRFIFSKISGSTYWQDRMFQASAQTLFHTTFRLNSFKFVTSYFFDELKFLQLYRN